jgi:hypothetical protein
MRAVKENRVPGTGSPAEHPVEIDLIHLLKGSSTCRRFGRASRRDPALMGEDERC